MLTSVSRKYEVGAILIGLREYPLTRSSYSTMFVHIAMVKLVMKVCVWHSSKGI